MYVRGQFQCLDMRCFLINATLFEYCITQWSMIDVIISDRMTEVCPFKPNYFEILQMGLKIAK